VGSRFGQVESSYVYSFIHTISIAPLQIHYYSEALPTQHGYCARISRWFQVVRPTSLKSGLVKT